MIAQPIRHPARQMRQLRADDRRRQVRHAQIVKRQPVLPCGKAVLQGCVFLPIMLIGARHDDGTGHQIGIIGDQDAPFARVDHLVGLKRETADFANRANLSPLPKRTQRMGGVFDHRHIGGFAKRHDRIHFRSVPAHMADDHSLNTGQFGGEILKIDAVILAHLAKHRLAACVDHRRGHGGESKPGDQHRRLFRQVQGEQGQKQRGRA